MKRLSIYLVTAISMWIGTDAYASSIQAQDPATIFARACATCHGAKGLGGVSWVKNNPQDQYSAPQIAGAFVGTIKARVRSGADNARMPGFGPQEITDSELEALAAFISSNPSGVPTPTKPIGKEIVLNILDADPWFTDGGKDKKADPFKDVRRVVLQSGQYLKVINTGRTWHTFTNASDGKDSGFIGYAGNYKKKAGDLDKKVKAGKGFYYADQATGLTPGCNKYICKMHPYMTVEVCTADNVPKGPTDQFGLTRAHKQPLGLPSVPGIVDEEVWVSAQSQEEVGEKTTKIKNNSVNDFDGAYQVINTATWNVTRIPNVGNNPHNAWPGRTSSRDVVVSTNWHDNRLSLIDATTKSLVSEFRSGAANAHVMVVPGASNSDKWFVSHMGGTAMAEISAEYLQQGQNPNVGLLRGASGPHGLWMCDDEEHFIVADTFNGSTSLYDIDAGNVATTATGGAIPLATGIKNGFGPTGCERGFAGNAGSADLSIYDITPTLGAEALDRNITWTAAPANGVFKNAAGNIAVRVADTGTDVATPHALLPTETIEQKRWAHLTIQSPISPPDATTHGRFMVSANKASFNVLITGLDPATGLPWGSFTAPAGLGAHGVTFGKKSRCDTNNDGTEDADASAAVVCYYAYVTNTFEDYVSVYDLEKIDVNDDRLINNPAGVGMQNPGSALLAERVYLEGGAVQAVITLDPGIATLCGSVLDCGTGPTGGTYVSNLPIGVLCPDCSSGVHVGDIPLQLTTGAPLAGPAGDPAITDSLTNNGAKSKYAYLKEPVWVDTMTVGCALGANDCDNIASEGTEVGNLNTQVTLDLELGINTGAQGIVVRPASAPWTP